MKRVFRRLVSVGDTLRNASDLQKLSNVGPMLGQRRHSDHDDRTKYKKKITNIDPKIIFKHF